MEYFIKVVKHHISRGLTDWDAQGELSGAADEALEEYNDLRDEVRKLKARIDTLESEAK